MSAKLKYLLSALKLAITAIPKEETKEWVEDEFWIFSGEGWIYVRCNEQILKNLSKIKPLI